MNTIELDSSRAQNAELLNDQTPSLLQREWQVLSGGLKDGLAGAGASTLESAGDFSKNFVKAPLETTGKYLKDHYHEAIAGAAITFLNPKKLANALLFAYSMRGLGVATYDGIVEAANPNTNIENAREKYSKAISHEGTAFVSSLPMALAGGAVGRSAANGVFGKDLGALDLATGKVSLTQVKDNLYAIKDTIAPPAVKLVITDMDNTLAPFGHYFAQGVKKGISDLSVKTKIPEQTLYESLGGTMDNYRSHDYPWTLEIVLGDKLNVGKPGGMSVTEFRTKIVEPFWKTIDDSLIASHKPYAGVLETLQELKARKIPVAVLSDAPAFVGLRRLTNLGLDKEALVERMYALNNWTQPKDMTVPMLAAGHERIQSMLSIPHQLKEVRLVPGAWEKPHTEGFKALMDEYKVRPSQVLMIGDSRVKDVGVAHNVGARAIWAEYGTPAAIDEAILTRLRPLPELGAAPKAPVKKTYAPYVEAAKAYESVLSHLEPKADYSSIAASMLKSIPRKPELAPLASYGVFHSSASQAERK